MLLAYHHLCQLAPHSRYVVACLFELRFQRCIVCHTVAVKLQKAMPTPVESCHPTLGFYRHMEAELLRAPLREAYRVASQGPANYQTALDLAAQATEKLPADPVLLAYTHALGGVGALYTLVPLEQFMRVGAALGALHTAVDTSPATPPEELELRLIRASFCEQLPVVFLAEGYVRQDAKRILSLLEAHVTALPPALTRLALDFLHQKVKLSFLDADRLAALRTKTHSG